MTDELNQKRRELLKQAGFYDNQIDALFEIFTQTKPKRATKKAEVKAELLGVIPQFMGNQTVELALADVAKSLQTNWLALYKDSDWITAEVMKAVIWCEANKHKAPKRFDRFMTNWLSNGWDRYRTKLPSKPANTSVSPANPMGLREAELFKKDLYDRYGKDL